MIRTSICELLGIEYPIALGGLGGGFTQPEMVAAVSEAGGFGALGCHGMSAEQVASAAAAIRQFTGKPFALNFLLFTVDDEAFAQALAQKPAAIALAWPRGDQDLKPYIDRSHEAGCKVTFMAGSVSEAVRGVEAGADVIVAQGSEGGGHVGWMASMVLVPMIVDAVSPVPVLAAGGFADGRGLAAALALGADGILLGTRFLASEESQLHSNFKNAILESDGHDTVLTEIPDLASGSVWPGAMSRARRNAFIERWMGREWAIRQSQSQVNASVIEARKSGDADNAPLSFGQDAGLITEILPTREIVRRIAEEAEQIVRSKLPKLTE
ncbi:MAG: nitronate monooxygenase family protein [Alphaproteobacteria bacterium]|jgi:NAD(P)H-dependent flavin oxidoreductase YrpB (nitropropane dioxygenase family)